MKKLSLFAALALALLLCGCCTKHDFAPATCTAAATCTKCGEVEGEALGHDWAEADCTAPRTCTRCGETEGEALGHSWIEATCTSAKTCARCGETEGEALGHDWTEATCTEPKLCTRCGQTGGSALGHGSREWTVVQEPTCSRKGKKTAVCDRCGEELERDIPQTAHTAGEWVVTVPATATSRGTRVKTCTVCGAEVSEERFELSAEERVQFYKDSCQSISYDSLSRTPDVYEGTDVKFTGRVLQVCSEATSAEYYSTYRVATSGRYDNVVMIYVDNYGSGTRILEDDWITFYGSYGGLYTYTTVLGASVTIPKIYVEYLD